MLHPRHPWLLSLLHVRCSLLLLRLTLHLLALLRLPLLRLPLLRFGLTLGVQLLIELIDVLDLLRGAALERLRAIDIDLDVAVDVLDANELVVRRSKRRKHEVEISQEHGFIPSRLRSPSARVV